MKEINNFLVKAGLRVILVKENSKQPVEFEWQTKNHYAPDSKEVQEHTGNLAGNLQESGFFVLDIDDPSYEPLFEKRFAPATFKVKTPHGFHYWFKIKKNEVVKNDE